MEKLKNGKKEVLQPFNPSNLQPFNPLILQSFNPSTPQLFKDSAIREMLRRRHAAVPPLSEDFEEKLFAAYEQRKRLQKRRNVRRLILWPSIAAAATVALLLVFGGKSHITAEPELASITTHVEKSVDISMPDKKTEENTVVKPKNLVRKKHITHRADKSIPIANSASADTSKANAPIERPSVASHPVFTPIHTASLSAKGEDIRGRMDEKFNEFAYIITKVKEESI